MRDTQNPEMHSTVQQVKVHAGRIPQPHLRRGMKRKAKFSRADGASLPLDGQAFLDQLLGLESLQQCVYRKRPAIGDQAVLLEVKGRGSPDFIRLSNNFLYPWICGLYADVNSSPFGRPLGIGSQGSRPRVPNSQGLPNSSRALFRFQNFPLFSASGESG